MAPTRRSLAIGSIAIMDQVVRSLLASAGLDQLAGNPFRGRMCCRRAFAYVSNKKTNGHSQSTQAAQTLDLLRSQETYEDLEKLREARARQ